ncbi:hypothetical protein FNV43_RR08411 [Rhamnella rubrinervis]|uniref:Uncharacterized protein n=1 Tax=Rhamnella rubrinervis TaxID=2594499 RepID=A0A8K0H8U5_9ROSA|nr:hypothetical protein FNV43_RR08411 [Rhamnella rubrinervis]
MAALQYLDSLRNSHPELSDWYTLADLYEKKLWHQLTSSLSSSSLSLFSRLEFCDCLVIREEERYLVDRVLDRGLGFYGGGIRVLWVEKEAAISYLDGVIEKLRATKEQRIEEPILYIKMQIAIFKLEQGDQKSAKAS